MRTLFLLPLLGLASATAHAQTPLTKGRGLITGSINYHYQNAGLQDAAVSSFSFTPSVGYFVTDNLALGLNLGIQTTSNSLINYVPVGSPQRYSNTTFFAGPFVRYYHFVGGDKFALFGQGSLGYLQLHSNYSNNINQGYIAVAPGLAFFPVPRFGVEASLQGIGLASNFDGVTSLDVGVGLQNLQVGVAYYFGK